MEKILIILPIVISLLSVIYIMLTFHYTTDWNKKTNNEASYHDHLNFHIEWDDTEGNTGIKGAEYKLPSGLVDKLPNQEMRVTATTGGIRSVSCLFYREGDCLANLKLDMSSEIEHEDRGADDMAYLCEVLSLYPQEYEQIGTKGRYLTSLFVVVEGYNDERYIVPTVFEFEADANGALTGKKEVREYSDVDILYTYNKDKAQLTEFDLQTLEDYKKIRTDLKEQ